MFHYLISALFALLLLSCSAPFNLTDRSGNTFVIESPKLEYGGNLVYKIGDATRELKIKDIVSLSIPEAEPKVFDGKVFYPANLSLEDSISAPNRGFICVEGTIIAENAGRDFSIPLANIKELNRQKKE
ncbi:hypothetical protein R83H12_01825 [Fibrobacteria bacterium R8-3-H12]